MEYDNTSNVYNWWNMNNYFTYPQPSFLLSLEYILFGTVSAVRKRSLLSYRFEARW